MATIYLLENKINGKRYIGQTTNWKKRFYSHRKNYPKTLIDRAIKKYSIDNFYVFHFDDFFEDELDIFEPAFIETFNSLYPSGYNLETGGNKRKHHHIETKRKISKTKKGVKFSEEHRHNISQSLLGDKNPRFGNNDCRSTVTCEKISKALTGKKRPLEVKKKISNSMSRESHPHWIKNPTDKQLRERQKRERFKAKKLLKIN